MSSPQTARPGATWTFVFAEDKTLSPILVFASVWASLCEIGLLIRWCWVEEMECRIGGRSEGKAGGYSTLADHRWRWTPLLHLWGWKCSTNPWQHKEESAECRQRNTGLRSSIALCTLCLVGFARFPWVSEGDLLSQGAWKWPSSLIFYLSPLHPRERINTQNLSFVLIEIFSPNHICIISASQSRGAPHSLQIQTATKL